ncbi:methylated-DNA--protein-cysteine S-methyltransferase [Streptococcus criceti]|uniref:Methylated-DNA--protein-cysteine methyltransferase n=1 Tax=Streptococcus criceti HS-6 TaxID=873449 RepID=G5JSN1_STRCG|nr:methylated-DNA--[protein]-cysteine S-methyltransferase [Streptococcus criceti]EHI75539.1 methylated-DNA--protein-cysteine S-methyltransferase [Streptococcus criceti HS-6]SUN37510.1 methylated-DNA--protein-cysteine S-methyltransferase [Streptococcus criceti]
MICKQTYQSPLGSISLIADDRTLLGAWFFGQKYYEKGFEEIDLVLKANSVLEQAKVWLDTYFAGQNPSAVDFLAPQGTAFQKRVWQVLVAIPAGSTLTYGQIAKKLNCRSAQAVGSAVGKNPISIFIPCHRVLGSQGKLTGYAGGLDKKAWLLEHEGLTITLKK